MAKVGKALVDRVRFVEEARRTPLLLVPAVIVAGVIWNWVQDAIAGDAMILGAPIWAWSVILALILLVWAFLEVGLRLFRRLEPAFDLSFDDPGVGIAPAIERQQLVFLMGAGPPGLPLGMVPQTTPPIGTTEARATYVRVRMDNRSSSTVAPCYAYIDGLEKKRLGQATPATRILLPQPVQLAETGFSLFPDIPKMIDFIRVSEADNKLSVIGLWPLTLVDEFDDAGIYTFTIKVHGGGITKAIKIAVTWNNHWDTISAKGES